MRKKNCGQMMIMWKGEGEGGGREGGYVEGQVHTVKPSHVKWEHFRNECNML
jgi:hypothetical protein